MEEVTLKLNKDLIQVNIQAIDIAVKAVGLNGAEALVVLAKTISEQTGETVAPPEQPVAEEVPAEVVE
jgi:hypothetical protein|tara:strand:+ start:3439 stop:3642 length:204 start_codon:yes stop_codon:yes gene_type:complete